MQLMWLDKIDWDDNILPQVLKCWQNFISLYNGINSITIPLWKNYSPNASVEIHAVIYSRIEIEGKVYTNLLIAKTKVALIKKPSIPRLELCGAVLLSKLVRNLNEQSFMSGFKFYLWCDSTIVLAWMKKPPCTWKTFVANRVAIILENVGNQNWDNVVSQQTLQISQPGD